MLPQTAVRRTLATVLAAAALIVPATASAGPLVAGATDCADQSLAQVFLPWADVASYTLQPGGDFEPGSPAWKLSAGADGATVNEPWAVTDDMDGRSLALTAGSSATSPSMCVGIEHPDIRFFARASSPGAVLNVEVLFEDAAGNVQSLQIGSVTGNTGWAPTAPMPIVANLLPLLPGSQTAVAFRVTAASGNWKIDDFYVDPYRSW